MPFGICLSGLFNIAQFHVCLHLRNVQRAGLSTNNQRAVHQATGKLSWTSGDPQLILDELRDDFVLGNPLVTPVGHFAIGAQRPAAPGA